MDEPLPPPRSPWERPLPGQEPVWLAPPIEVSPAPSSGGSGGTRSPGAGRGRHRAWLIAAACMMLVAASAVAFVLTRDGRAEGDQAGELSELASATAGSTQSAAVAPSTSTATETTPTTTVLPSPSTGGTPPTTAPPSTVPSTIGPTDVAPGTYSFAEANAVTHMAQRFRMTIAASGDTTVAEGAIDEHNRIDLTMTVGRDESLRMIMDTDNGLVYYAGGPFDDVLTDDAEWVQVNLASVLERSGQSVDGFLENMTGHNPATGMLDEDLVPLGLTDIDGQRVMLYWVSLDQEQFSELVQANPQFADGGTLQQSMLDADSVTYEFSVTEGNTLRRMVSVIKLYGQEITTTYDYFPLEPDYEVQLPDPATVQLLEDSGG